MATQQELLTQQLSKLADTFRKKFNTTKGLTIDDMINLNTNHNIMIIDQSNFTLNNSQLVSGRIVRLGSTLGDSSWCTLDGFSVSRDKAMKLLNDTSHYKLLLHLWITKITGSGTVWLKWNDNNSRNEFGPKLGENILNLPPLLDFSNLREYEFNLVLHPMFNYIEVDTSKSYLEAEYIGN